LDLSTKGLSVNKIAEVVKVCPETVRKWTGKAASHCEKVNESTLTGVETEKLKWTSYGLSWEKNVAQERRI
jgi:hypothetical protein